MRESLRVLSLFLALLAGGVAHDARAQAIAGVQPPPPEVDLSAAYAYLGSNTVTEGTSIHLSGARLSATYYIKNWLAAVGDLGFYRQFDVVSSGFSLTVSTYQFGPRVRLRNRSRLTPFGQFLLGAGHAGGTLYTRSLGPGLSPLGPNNALSYTAGGGADWKLNPRIAIRVVQMEYLHSQFLNGFQNRQDNVSVSTGVVFTFGSD